jgi:hypothetical protein
MAQYAEQGGGRVSPQAFIQHPLRLAMAAAQPAPEPHGEELPPIAARSRWSRCLSCAEPVVARRRQHFTVVDVLLLRTA